ncbi:DUF4252 domain-containing protein [Muricauda sp. MAR_2010_75]|jgi:hypothetical protein|uniref:DUF4252 domain-containing protein n=1 Tax=Allomuricauda sp. MAR_2010_75 TaxID=1250232 RepID=UPI00056C47BE|nr:DUF4252 domain-containing protein [Muricauda sp. MAR_2010_75]
MKRNILIVLIAVLPLSGFSQSLFDRFEDMDDVTSVVVNKSMFNLLAKIDVEVDDPEARDFMDIASSLQSLKVFTTDNESIGSDMKSSVNSYLKSSKMEELMRVKDKDANVKFYIKQGRDDNHVSELLMLVSDIKEIEADGRKIETVLLSLTGDIDLNKINSLTKKMNLPEELNKAGKNN